MAKGIIYVCSTAVDGLVKIGKTQTFEKRMSELERNGYRNVTSLKREFAIEVNNYDEIEALLHDIFSKSQLGDTELFSLDINQVIQLLSAFQGQQIYPNPIKESKEEMFENATDAVIGKRILEGTFTIDIDRKDGSKAYGILFIKDGVTYLGRGSKISELTPSVKDGPRKVRSSLLLDSNGYLQEDTKVSSPSLAATLVKGSPQDGWTEWKDKNGKLLDYYRKQALKDFDDEE